MVIAYGSDGVIAHITLMKDERLPNKWNIPATIVYRWEEDRSLTCIKAYGNVWHTDDVRLDKPFEPDITKEHDPWGGLSVGQEDASETAIGDSGPDSVSGGPETDS